MIPRDHKTISEADRILQSRLRAAAAAILLAGLAAAAVVRRNATPDYDSAYVKMLNNTKRNEYEMEVIGGKANIFAAELREWFAGLWHGREFATTLAVLSIGGSLFCLFVAHRLNYAPRPAALRHGEDGAESAEPGIPTTPRGRPGADR